MPAGEQPMAVFAKISTITGLLDRLFAAPTDLGLLEQLEKLDPTELVTQAWLDGTYAIMIAQLHMLQATARDDVIRHRLRRLHRLASTTSPAFFTAQPPTAHHPIVWVSK